MERTIRLGTRGSKLALWQAQHVKDRLQRTTPGISVSVVVIKTTADVATEKPLARFGSQGVFVKELESALLDGAIDLAVHSLKDVPTALAPGLTLGAILEREDPRDTLVSPEGCKLGSLAEGSVVGTSSPRRVAQLLNLRPDLVLKDIRGNLDTRLRKMESGEFQALVLARAGIKRLAPAGVREVPFNHDEMLPAPGQGAIAIELRSEDEATRNLLAPLHHDETARSVAAERSVLAALGGGCQLPVGCLATVNSRGKVVLRAVVADRRGRKLLRAESTGTDPILVGNRLAEKLRFLGADILLKESDEEAQ
jgi:hydroxymethylbilane synthase